MTSGPRKPKRTCGQLVYDADGSVAADGQYDKCVLARGHKEPQHWTQRQMNAKNWKKKRNYHLNKHGVDIGPFQG